MTAGCVALVRFPFTDLELSRKRPALVLAHTVRSARNGLVTVAMITSQIEALRIDGDVVLVDWNKAGLLHPSLLRLGKIATIDQALVEKQLGSLSSVDNKSARQAFRHLFKPWLS